MFNVSRTFGSWRKNWKSVLEMAGAKAMRDWNVNRSPTPSDKWALCAHLWFAQLRTGTEKLKNESLLVIYQVLFSHHIWAKEAYSFFFFFLENHFISFKQEAVWPFGEESCRVGVQNTSKYGNRMCLLAFVRCFTSRSMAKSYFKLLLGTMIQ